MAFEEGLDIRSVDGNVDFMAVCGARFFREPGKIPYTRTSRLLGHLFDSGFAHPGIIAGAMANQANFDQPCAAVYWQLFAADRYGGFAVDVAQSHL